MPSGAQMPTQTIPDTDRLRLRAFRRAAWVLHDCWDANGHPAHAVLHTRVIDHIVWQFTPVVGTSKKGGGHREHVVPLVRIQTLAFEEFAKGATFEDVGGMIGVLLRIAHIHPAEAKRLDQDLGLKEVMPEGWSWRTGDPLARLIRAEIELVPSPAL